MKQTSLQEFPTSLRIYWLQLWPLALISEKRSSRRMATKMQSMINKALSTKFKSVNFKTCLPQTIEDIVSSIQYLVKVTDPLLKTEKLLGLIAHVVKTELTGSEK